MASSPALGEAGQSECGGACGRLGSEQATGDDPARAISGRTFMELTGEREQQRREQVCSDGIRGRKALVT
jgi:hypothetical protein